MNSTFGSESKNITESFGANSLTNFKRPRILCAQIGLLPLSYIKAMQACLTELWSKHKAKRRLFSFTQNWTPSKKLRLRLNAFCVTSFINFHLPSRLAQ